MQTLGIIDITDEYNKEIKAHDSNYTKLFCIIVKHNDGNIEYIRFGYNENWNLKILRYNEEYDYEGIREKIMAFSDSHKMRLMYDSIDEIPLDDGGNVLNYQRESSGLIRK